ncbi:MAG: putative LPS assembly protein LptD [Bacteroidetes bacterium]|nr:putative LPS assembly protein LptD [Bacteroidota bacterium]MCY4205061.1 putative LPS assembly protein LptD [Bacteroidota bacterium]
MTRNKNDDFSSAWLTQTVAVCLLILLPQITRAQEGESLNSPVKFSAQDSLVLRFNSESGDRGTLIGNANVSYEGITLRAHFVDLLLGQDELVAYGLPTDSGLVGSPIFSEGNETLTGSRLAYNIATGQGRVTAARTQFEEGFIQAGIAKVREDSVIFIQDGLYTTCNCGPDETPSYSLRARRMKIVDQKWVYTGPIQLYIFNIPMPIWLPFGFLPYQEGRRSGLLAPQYGEDERGFFLRNWGWYFAINDNMDAQVRLGLWTKGSWQVNPSFRYNRRNNFSGNLNIDYLQERSGERQDPDVVKRRNLSIRWGHNQTFSPKSRFSANVNLTTSTYLRTVSDQYEDNIRQSIGSSIQYNHTLRGGRSISLSMRQQQVLSTGSVDLTFPQISFSQSTKTPFKREGGGRDQRWYERLQYSITSRTNNQYQFRPISDEELIANGDTLADGRPVDYAWYEALFDEDKYRASTGRSDGRIRFTATHRIPISAPFAVQQIPLLGSVRLNLAPNINYTEDWFISSERRQLNSDGTLETRTEQGFISLRQFNAGVSANTTIYGLFPVKLGSYEGLRHTVRPRLGFSYRPDFGSDTWGYTRPLLDQDGTVVVDTLASGLVSRRYPIVRGVQSGLQNTLSFGVDNTFETKRVSTDSTGSNQSRALKLFTVNISSSYNFAADSLGMSPMRISARTNILGKFNINFSSTFSPYKLSPDGRRIINDYIFSLRDFAFARLTQLSVRGSMQLRGSIRSSESIAPPNTQTMPQFGAASFSEGVPNQFSQGNMVGGTQDWSMNLSFVYQISRPQLILRRSATINTGFNFGLTPTWRVQGQTGYDFERKQLVTTTLNLSKEFECWNMGFRWIPFGAFQSWGFDLHVKSGRLAEFLRFQQPRAERNRGFGGSRRPRI